MTSPDVTETSKPESSSSLSIASGAGGGVTSRSAGLAGAAALGAGGGVTTSAFGSISMLGKPSHDVAADIGVDGAAAKASGGGGDSDGPGDGVGRGPRGSSSALMTPEVRAGPRGGSR